MTAADAGEISRRIAADFDLAAEGYDGPPLRFFPFAADRLALRLAAAPGEKVLDVAAGTGVATLAVAQAVGPAGRVIAIDISERMLERLERKLRQFGIQHVDVHTMDGARLDFRRDYFHHVVSSFGLAFMPDMEAALREWQRVLRPGGQVMFSSFGAQAFQPMKSLFFARLAAVGGGQRLEPPPRLVEPPECRRLLEAAGYRDVRVETGRIGYHLKNAAEWWEIVWSSALRGHLRELRDAPLAVFRDAHLAEVEAGTGPEGLWLEVEVNYASGRKPGAGDAVAGG